ACTGGMKEVAQKLLAEDKVREHAHVDNNYALRFACTGGMKEVAQKLLAEDKVRENAHVYDNWAFNQACRLGMSELVLKLLAEDKVREHAHVDNNFALILACSKGLSDKAMKLLEQGQVKKNAHAVDNLALREACRNGMSEVAMKLVEQPKVLEKAHKLLENLKRENKSLGPSDILHTAIVRNNKNLVNKLLKIRSIREDFGKIQKMKEGGWVDKNGILAYACKNKMWDCVNVLLEIEEYKKTIGQMNNVALRYAHQHGNVKIMLKLLGLKPARRLFVKPSSSYMFNKAMKEGNIQAISTLIKLYRPEEVSVALKINIAEKLMVSKENPKQVMEAYNKLRGIISPQEFQSMKKATGDKIMDFVRKSSNSSVVKKVDKKTGEATGRGNKTDSSLKIKINKKRG
ncbi:MAG TPA: hypothetical protein QF353_00970, partial [Gammaproteobacteria bacterium]|nr:hypothetical protein [Gammaproteobacteria bacterium]